jgi:hypothetical protein
MHPLTVKTDDILNLCDGDGCCRFSHRSAVHIVRLGLGANIEA